MENNRRSFLKFAGVSVLGLGSLSLLDGLTSDDVIASSGQTSAEATYKKTANALTAKRWGMVIDTKKLSGRICRKMEKACHREHNVPHHENKKHEINGSGKRIISMFSRVNRMNSLPND